MMNPLQAVVKRYMSSISCEGSSLFIEQSYKNSQKINQGKINKKKEKKISLASSVDSCSSKQYKHGEQCCSET
jgi:hypothetical protein